jgi:potassium large conductance calcium-activated channel subfamily M alpha protein 1
MQRRERELITSTDLESKGQMMNMMKPGGGKSERERAEIGWMTEAKDWAGELISGQSMTGKRRFFSLRFRSKIY